MLSTFDVKSLQEPRALGKASDLFIIAAEKDSEMANKIYASLQQKGFNVWNKTESIVIGGEEEIAQGIEKAGVIAYLISNDVWGSDVCQKELTVALADDKHIIPLLVAPSPLKGIVSSVFTVPLIDFTDPKKYDISLEQLSQQIRKLGVRSRSEIAAVRVPAPRRQITSWQPVLAALFIAAMGFTGGMLYQAPRVQEAIETAAVARQNEQQAKTQAQKATTAAATARQNEQQAKTQAQKATAVAAVARQNEQQAKTQAQKSDAIATVARKNERDAKTNLSIVLGRERIALKAEKDAKTNLSIVIKREKQALGREEKAVERAGQADLRALRAEQRVDTLINLLTTCESGNPSPVVNPSLNP